MKNKSKIMSQISSAYILLPFLIFALGWMKLIYSIPITIALLFCFGKVCKESPELWMPEFDRETIVKVVFIVSVIAIWVYYSGVGKFVFQNLDHMQRNTIFNILVEYEWPVINYNILERNAGTTATGLIYYIGFWLPAAIVGKVFGLQAGYCAQAVWAILGISLVYYFVCSIREKIVVWPLWIMIFFSGLDIVANFLTNVDIAQVEHIWHLEWWGTPYQYSSMTTQLFWTFNQSVPAWLCTILAYKQYNNRNLVFILACCMLTSTLPFIGLLLLVIYWCLTREYDVQDKGKQKLKMRMISLYKDTFSVQNILGGGIIGVFSFLYLINNVSGSRLMGENIKGPAFDNTVDKYLIFMILEVGIYIVLLYKYNKNNMLFYFVTFCLCIIPPIKVGFSTDFCMRASIPALFVLMLMVIDALEKAWNKKDYLIAFGLILTLLIGSATPVFEFRRTFTETFRRINVGEQVFSEDDDPIIVLNADNFAGDIEGSIFFEYFVK